MSHLVDQVLKENNLSVTLGRKKVLELFLKADCALVFSEIEKKSHSIIDRVTVYRTLQTFLEKGLIHLIPTTDNLTKYALTKGNSKRQHIYANHIHFFCSNCNKTICLDEVNTPKIKLRKGYREQSYQLVVTGICANCK